MLATIACVAPYHVFGWSNPTDLNERWILWALASVITLAHLHYAVGVVSSMSQIECDAQSIVTFLINRFVRCVITSKSDASK